MKVVTVLGTRPEIIRLSTIIAKLDETCDHVLVNTGQNFDHALSELFFSELGVRQPDYSLGVRGESPADQVGKILVGCEAIFRKERPDRILILGDTNSALCAIIAKRMGIPVFHMEAGNRCYDDRVPEEVNRRLIDHSSDVLLPYTERSRANLLREGIAGNRIYVTGNPILEVIEHYEPQITQSTVLADQDLNEQGYFLVTLHRAENVDPKDRFTKFASALRQIGERYEMPILVSTHPRMKARIDEYGLGETSDFLRFPGPFGLFDFITLEKNARCVLSDSGTVQEECSIFGVPNVTLRDVTERPETIECGSNILAGADPESILSCVELVLTNEPNWSPPPEYMVKNVSSTIARLMTGFSLDFTNGPNS